MLNGRWVRGLQMKVSMAKQKKLDQKTRRATMQGGRRGSILRKEWRKKHKEGIASEENHAQNHQIPPIQGARRRSSLRKEWRRKYKAGKDSEKSYDQNHQELQIQIVGQSNKDHEDWLERTLVCTSEVPRDLATLESALLTGTGLSFRLSALSCFKFLLIFPTLESMQEALVCHQDFQQWFIEVKRWGIEDCCESRRVWLDIIGVPPHGWLWENFKAIAEIWGQLICLGKSSSRIESFEVMKVLIATKILRKIEAEIVITIGFGGYRVMIRETETISQLVTKFPHLSICTNKVDQSSDNSVPGFEDIDDNISHHKVEDGDEEQSPYPVQNFSNETRVEESSSSKDSRQQAISRTRTPTVSFSQNGYSEEVFKVQQHLRKTSVTKEAEQSQSLHDSQPPPGFGFVNEKEINLQQLTEARQPMSKACLSHQQEVDEECLGTQSNSCCREFIEQDCANQLQQEEQEASKKLNFKKALTQTPESSNSSSESLVQLAYDSLKFGELLGVRVTGNVEAAISRIVTPLKKIRRKGKKLK